MAKTSIVHPCWFQYCWCFYFLGLTENIWTSSTSSHTLLSRSSPTRTNPQSALAISQRRSKEGFVLGRTASVLQEKKVCGASLPQPHRPPARALCRQLAVRHRLQQCATVWPPLFQSSCVCADRSGGLTHTRTHTKQCRAFTGVVLRGKTKRLKRRAHQFFHVFNT